MFVYSASIISAVIIFGMALLQISLIFGAPLGEYVLGGKNKVLPMKMRFISAIFVLIFIVSGISYLQIGGVTKLNLSDSIIRFIVMIDTLFFAYAIIGNGIITKSKKEKLVMTPFSVVQFILSVIVLAF